MTGTQNLNTETEKASHRGNGRITFLDAIRGLASFIVVIGHSIEAAHFSDGGGQLVVNLGRIGIIAFFLVSGYVVAFSLSRQTITVFWTRRFFRLFPVYWVCVIGYMLVNFPIWDERYTITFVNVIFNLLMIQGFVGVASFLWPTWTLGNELVFYGQQSLTKAWIKPKLSVHLGWLWLVLFAVLAIMTRLTPYDFSAIAPLVIFTASVGMAVYLRDTTGSRAWIPYTVAFIVVVPALGWVLQGDPEAFPSSVWTAGNFNISYLLGGALFLAFYLMRNLRMPKLLLWLGDISYELYLAHAIVLLALARLGVSGWGIVLLGVPLSIAAGYLVHRFVGKPAQNLGIRITKRRRANASSRSVSTH
ncbi:acyltransferase family protein [Microbacterium sp. zg.Y909]|uniref:acyltransferase family protein n=1 Tax=Microbacterium sp. zg.Y909 TaxID=2969413 RepID=UPI00214C9DC9|nr:acyltransferase [Microbacterium sp. zg.Y909]MCR2823952.1 acyltransferase [Microbacterium sp. zg.Y909]